MYIKFIYFKTHKNIPPKEIRVYSWSQSPPACSDGTLTHFIVYTIISTRFSFIMPRQLGINFYRGPFSISWHAFLTLECHVDQTFYPPFLNFHIPTSISMSATPILIYLPKVVGPGSGIGSMHNVTCLSEPFNLPSVIKGYLTQKVKAEDQELDIVVDHDAIEWVLYW